MSEKTETLSAEDLRSKLYHSLKEKGLLDTLKSQIRNRMVTELKQIGVAPEFPRQPAQGDEGSLLLRAANSLVADHLRRCHYDYSTSVFLPEAALSSEKLFTTQDLLQLLNISPHCKLYRNLCEQSVQSYTKKGFLWQLLCEIAKQHGMSCKESGVQTDQFGLPPTSSLQEKFGQVDDYYTHLSDSSRQNGVEERILAYQRQLEERNRTEIRLEISRFKETELLKMRMEEREKSQKEAERLRQEMERTYKAKYDALLERERNAFERLQKQQEIQEKETFSQRQSILEEIDIVRQRDTELRRQIEIYQRERQLLEERVKTKEENIRKREEAVKIAEIEYEQKINAQMTKFKTDQEQRYMQRFKDLEWREMKVKEDERRVGDELMEITKTKDELRDKRIKVNELENEVEKLRRELMTANYQVETLSERTRGMVDYQVLKDENLVLKRDIEQTKLRLAECNRDLMLERQKHEETLREMGEHGSRPTVEVLLLQRELDKARTQLRQDQVVNEHQKQQTQIQLQEEVERNRTLMRRYEEQTLQLKDMNRELNDLRRQLGHTQTALNNEVYRNPKGNLLRSESPSLCDLDNAIDVKFDQVQVTPTVYSDTELVISRDDDDHICGTSHSEDYSYSSDLVHDTKKRLNNLEKEAEALEENYRNFQFRLTNVSSLGEIGKSRLASSIVRTHQDLGGIDGLSAPLPSSGSAFNTSRPLSSTPNRGSEGHMTSQFTPPSRSLHRQESRHHLDLTVSSVHSTPDKSEGRKTTTIHRPMKMSDLDARPGSPSVVVLEGSDGSHNNGAVGPLHVATASLGIVEQKDTYRISPPGQEISERTETNLDSAWKSNKEADDQMRREAERRRQEEDKEYEEQRRNREEERMKREQESWEAEQKALEDLQKAERQRTSSVSGKESPQESEKQEADEGIDPVMKKYMEMVAKQKEREKEVTRKSIDIWTKGKKPSSQISTPSVSEKEFSLSDDKSNGKDGTDSEFADW